MSASGTARRRCVIYDFDGTLVNSLPLVVEATRAVLRQQGVTAPPAEAIIAGMVHPTAERMGFLVGVREPTQQRRLAQDFYHQAHALGPSHARVYPGIPALVAWLDGQGVSQGVVSNNQGLLVRLLMESCGLSREVRLIWGEEDVPAPKPDGRGVTAAISALGCQPAQGLFVGDGVTDVGAAHAAGLPIIGVTWGIHSRGEMERMGFDQLVESVHDLRQALARHLEASGAA